MDAGDQALLAIGRYYDGEAAVGVFNFSEQAKTACLPVTDEQFTDLLTGGQTDLRALALPPYGFCWAKQQ